MYRVYDNECIDRCFEDYDDAHEYANMNACAVADSDGTIIDDFREE